MKKIIYLLSVSLLVAANACTEEKEELSECELVRQQRYSDMEVASFSINNGETISQNYGHQTFPEKKREQLHPFAQLWEFTNEVGTFANCELHFTRIGFDEDDCNPTFLHQFSIQLNLDQKPFESVTYPINSTGHPSSSFASYGGVLLNENELLRFTQDGAGSITITKYIPDSDIEGNYSIDIGGIIVTGNFDYDLTRSY